MIQSNVQRQQAIRQIECFSVGRGSLRRNNLAQHSRLEHAGSM
jgi:hypothetical protein